MSIKGKLVLTFLSVSLVSLIVSNSLLYFDRQEQATREVLNHLESVASIQRSRIQDLYQQNQERLRLVASRTQLRLSLDKFNKTSEPLHQDKMNRIIEDASNSIDDFKTIMIIALDGRVVAATDRDWIGQSFLNNEVFESGKKENRADFFKRDQMQELIVQLSGPLYLKEHLLGVLVIESAVTTMMSSISDYTGLGETGETTLASRTHEGDAIFILPTRFNKDAALNLRVKSDLTRKPMIHAVNGDERVFENSDDYRGESVLSVTRYIEDAQWGLAVKIDKREAFAHLTSMRNRVAVVILGCSFIIIMVSLYFAEQITLPIIRLTETVKNIIAGDLSVRADESSNDESGTLGTMFNLMTTSLHDEQNKLKRSKEELANREALFRGVLESSNDGVLMADSHGQITLVNQALADMTGYSINELVGQTIEKLVADPLNNHKSLRNAYIQNPSNRKISAGKTLYALHKTGSQFPVEISLTSVNTDQGIIVTAMIQDISIRHKTAREKEDLVKSLEEKNAELERFTYTVSHDLKSPLVTINGFIGLLEKDIADKDADKIESDFTRIKEATNVMQNLLHDLLELSRIGRQDSIRVDVPVNELIDSVLKILETKINATKAKITVTPNLPSIHVEEARFKEVFLNLIENSLNYRRDNVASEITIGTLNHEESHEENHDKVTFFVKDNGTGIDPRYHEKIFKLFERLNSNNEGTGVGLAIVKRIMEVHAGRIWVESDKNEYGSTFFFTLPQLR
ncbi:MAG: PAS domain S-box protein [Pseudomonadales bacterium]|nr:PAS domain S-box protein [Pseudomonadales bacterium]